MGYGGQIVTIPFGTKGLRTDDSHTLLPMDALTRAENVNLQLSFIEKAPGSMKWNKTSTGSPLVAHFDWFPNDITQRQMLVLENGTVRKFRNVEESVTVAASGNAPTLLNTTSKQVFFVAGGAESINRNRKLLLFTGNNPVQVISGDADVRTDLTLPPTDWASSFPTFGVAHLGRIWAFGNSSDPHRVYASSESDHEDFTGSTLTFPIFPGDGERLISAKVYKGRLFFFKFPQGVYYLDTQNSFDTTLWGIKKLTGSFGIASVNSAIEMLDDLVIANSTGSITSMSAADTFGDVKSGDILSLLRNEGYMRETTSQAGRFERHAVYYSDKKLGLFTYRGAGSVRNDRILVIDISTGPQNPKVVWWNKDRPNFLSLMKDINGVERPVYGNDDGFLYTMDREDRDVGGVAYKGEFETPNMDFREIDAVLSEQNKLYQFLEVVFDPTGDFNLDVEVFIDGKSSETISFSMSDQPVLDEFVLDDDALAGRTPFSLRKPIHGMGRRIALRGSNDGLRENFQVTAINIYYKRAGQNQRNE